MLHSGLETDNDDPEKPACRNDFIVLSDIRRIEKDIEAESVRLHSEDGKSVFRWAEKLRACNALLGFKSTACPVPPGSGLAADTFFLAIQTPWQRAQYRKYGTQPLCIDGTHNTTMYENTTLTTIVVRDRWGHGEPDSTPQNFIV